MSTKKTDKTIKLNGKDIPCKDVLKIKMKMVTDEIFYEFTYRETEPSYHETKVLVPRDKAAKLEKAVRKACQ